VIYNQALSIASNCGNVGEVLRLERKQSAGSKTWNVGRRWVGRVAAAALTTGIVILAGCGNNYRPVLATIGVIGPAGQPVKYAIAVSSPSPTSSGLMTMVDFSGDTVLVTTPMGVNPYYLALDTSGSFGYTLNSDKTVSSFNINTSLIASQVTQSTLPTGTNPVSLFSTNNTTYISDQGVPATDQMTGNPPALQQELPVPSGFTPVYVVGGRNATRLYSLAQSTSGALGIAQAIETSAGNAISNTITVGRNPIYGVMSVDNRRAFVMNQGDNTVSVINTQTNGLDTHINTIPVGTRPVWGDTAAGLDELVVLNEGTGTTPGSLSVITVPLCSAAALSTNPNCDPTNPIDAATFGQVVATVPVGINPIMVSVLSDFTRAYVANAGDPTLPCATDGVAVAGRFTTCTISVVNLTSNTVTATIPISGHPAWIATAASQPSGKVYVVCKDSQVMTVIKTDSDRVWTTIPLQGFGVSVRMTTP
jgi:YVTN family beta-propeller protein